MLNIRSNDDVPVTVETPSSGGGGSRVLGMDKQILYHAAIGTVFILLCCVIIRIMRSVDKLSSTGTTNSRSTYQEMP